jgi:hypothetical protein
MQLTAAREPRIPVTARTFDGFRRRTAVAAVREQRGIRTHRLESR